MSIDAADGMNRSAANALLKVLEEPPARTALLLVAHSPASLLATIRSRCRTLDLRPLGPADLSAALAEIQDIEGYATNEHIAVMVARVLEPVDELELDWETEFTAEVDEAGVQI